jgi:membrane protein
MVETIKKIIYFITHGIWLTKESEIEGRKTLWFFRQLKVILYTATGIGKHDIMMRSAALTFYTMMSIVPIAALVFAIFKGFGMESMLYDYLYTNFADYKSLIDNVITFAQNLLQRTKGGLIAGVGMVVLLWSVVKVFGNIERAFNNIWEIRKQRSIARKFSDYIAVIFIAPILWAASNSLAITVQRTLGGFMSEWVVDLLLGLGSLVIVWAMFVLVYFMLPNTKVKFGAALTSGMVAGTAFYAFQLFYILIQTKLSSYNAIYGSFAALPLFLLWMQTSWQILLFGAELSFAYQNIKRYEHEREASGMSADQRRKILVAVMAVITRHFTHNQGPVSSETAASELGLPVRIIRDVVFDLESAGLVAAVQDETNDKTNLFVPAKDVHTITVFEVANAIDMHEGGHYHLPDNADMKRVAALIDGMKSSIDSSDLNVKITEII